MKELPTGLQVFEYIRTSGALYVDKTAMVHKLVSGVRKQFFLARPRRFGKTLLCWTLNALFSGKRELFEGLAISKTDWAWESYPVIHLDMSKVLTTGGVNGIKKSLTDQTGDIAGKHGINLHEETEPGRMLELTIVKTAEKYNRPAVVIVDEYDSPFVAFYNDPPMAEEVRKIMRSYYSQLKANESHMRFLFMTGIAKFTKAGVFSTLNNLNDLSMDEDFGTMFGYTQEELTEYFSEYIDAGAKKLNITVSELVDKMKHCYNGFCFDGIHKVYNPISVLNFFHCYEFDNFWMETANPKIVTDYMMGRKLTVEQFRGMPVLRDFVRYPGEMDSTPPEGFLHQAGYLTIREKIGSEYLLDYPNTEVLNSMSRLVAQNIVESGGEDFMDFRTPLLMALKNGKNELVIDTLNRLLSSIPYNDYTKAAKQALRYSNVEITTQEWLYRSTILAFLRGCGVLTLGEMHNSQGRSDLLVVYNNMPWIIEIKIARNNDNAAKAQEAMAQINNRHYDGIYTNAKKLAIAIDEEKRRIEEWIAG
ncbi:MAG: ATP-binding protein [Chitinispirillia bacterium]|nr:ATP-binding protein [Chitinispirillia bacterium]